MQKTGCSRSRLSYAVLFFPVLLFLAAAAHAQGASGWAKSFAAAEAAFNSRSQYSSVSLFQSLIQEITLEKGKRSLTEAESTLLCKSYDYLGQAYYNHGDFAPAYQGYSKLLELNPAYKLNEDLVSPKIVKFVEDIRAQLPKAPPPPPEVKTQPVAPVQPPGSTPSLMIVADTSCTVNLDGKDLGSFKANDSKIVTVSPGQHFLVATSGKQVWRKVVEVKQGQVIANIELSRTSSASGSAPVTRQSPPPEKVAPPVVKPADPEPEPVKPAEPEPQPSGGGKVTLYVYRTGDVITAAPSVFMDSVELAKVGRGQYFVAEIEPGAHSFRFSGWGYIPPGRGQGTLYEGSRMLSLDPGEYYLRIFFEKNSLNLVSDRMAKPDVAACRLVDMTSVKNHDLVVSPR